MSWMYIKPNKSIYKTLRRTSHRPADPPSTG